MRTRYVVLFMLMLLSVITYMDRVCISFTGPRMQEDLGISKDRWGWVLGAFLLGYGLFEIPSGGYVRAVAGAWARVSERGHCGNEPFANWGVIKLLAVCRSEESMRTHL